MVSILIGNRLSKVLTVAGRSSFDRGETPAAPQAESQEVAPMASVVLPGTPGGMGATSGLLVVESRGGFLAGADTIQRLPGRATVLAGFIGTSSMTQPPTEVAITESMSRFTRIAHAAGAG
jgi:hypothetical protein